MGPYLTDTLKRKLVFLTGKGGVGKTTLTSALAHAAKEAGLTVGIATFNTLATLSIPPAGVQIHHLETQACFREYALKILRFDRLYSTIFDNKVLKTFIRAAPGLSDTVLAGKIWDLVHTKAQDLLIVDLPSSGHTLSFFQSPLGVSKVFQHGFVHEKTKNINQLFTSSKARIDLVVIPNEFSVSETLELHTGLQKLAPFPFGFCLQNQLLPSIALESVSERSSGAALLERNYRIRFDAQTAVLADTARLSLPSISLPFCLDRVKRIFQLSERLFSA